MHTSVCESEVPVVTAIWNRNVCPIIIVCCESPLIVSPLFVSPLFTDLAEHCSTVVGEIPVNQFHGERSCRVGRVSSVGIATGYGLDGPGIESNVDPSGRAV